MEPAAVSLAKLAGIRKSVASALVDDVGRQRSDISGPTHELSFDPRLFRHYFEHADDLLDQLRSHLPVWYSDFHDLDVNPTLVIANPAQATSSVRHYSRSDMERLVRDIDQIFEIRPNSELVQTMAKHPRVQRRVFITHGRSEEWRHVQAYIEKDVNIMTMELAQEASLGMTIIEKLIDGSEKCDSAVIVMTGDDIDIDGTAKARENVMHEIGFFQASYGRSRVALLHEVGVSIPTNLSGVVYIPFPKGIVSASFHVLNRELQAMYRT